MSDSANLYISSGLHLTKVKSRFDSVTKEADSLDVLFVEGVYFDANSIKGPILDWLAFPFGLLAMRLYIFLLSSIGSLTGRTDQNLIYKLSSHYNAEIVEVDENIHHLIAEGRYAWAVGHWAMAFICFAGLSNWMEVTAPYFQRLVTALGSAVPDLLGWIVLSALTLQIFSWFLLGGAILFLLFAAGTLTTRNRTIISNIEEYIKSNPITDGCLIIGRSHETEIVRLVRKSELIEFTD